MTAYEYLNALRDALGVLPEDERENAIRYYEEYFLDAGPENEARVIEELGAPEQIARQILGDYKEVARVAPRPESGQDSDSEPLFGEDGNDPPRGFSDGPFQPPRRSPLASFLILCGALFLGVFIGIPLLGAAVSVVVALVAAALAVLAVPLLLAVALLIVLPLGLLVAGFLLCVFSLFLWSMPASAVLTLGAGLCLLALGGMLSVGCLRLCAVSFRPLLRAAGWCVEQCGRFFRWCVDVTRRFLDRLKGV